MYSTDFRWAVSLEIIRIFKIKSKYNEQLCISVIANKIGLVSVHLFRVKEIIRLYKRIF